MASIRKRAWNTARGEHRESWQVDFVDQQGKRRHKQFARKKDADAFLVTARGQVAAGTFTPESTSATLGEAIDGWLTRAQAEGLEAGTVQQYRQLAAHVRALLPAALKLAKLSTARVEQFRDDLLKAHSRPMARKILGGLKSVLKDARRRGLVAQNVAAETVIGANGRHKKRLEVGVDVPTPAEVRTMLEAADPKGRAMVALAALGGLRASELRALRWPDLQLGAEPTVTVAQRADRWARVGSPKSATSRRTVPLGETAAKALKEWKLAQPPRTTKENGEEKRIPRVLVFGTASDKPDMLGNLQRRLLTPLCAAAGVPRYSWHSLRHYAVSAWLASGIDPKTVQHWAGHSTLTLTIDLYGHTIPRPDDHQRIAAAERALVGDGF
jgi:integrase